MDDTERTRLDALVDLLADEVAQRLDARAEAKSVEPEPPPTITAITVDEQVPDVIPASPIEPAEEPVPEPEAAPAISMPSHAAALMARLAIGVLVAIVLINIPFNSQGTALARAIPNSASLVIMNGLVVKEENSPDIWVYRDSTFHWITSLDAFDHLGFRWQDVHIVEPGFLSVFEKGKPLYVLLKCNDSPHIYRLENNRKRWIVDIPTFEAEGHVWQDVKFVPCPYLRSFPDGETIPPGRGTPSPPLP